MTTAYSWRLKLAVVAMATFGTLALGVGAGEFAVRYRERHRTTVPSIMPFLYYRHARLGYALVRDFDYYGWVHTTPEGFRGTRSVPVAKTPEVFRVLAVGGSTTFDSYVSTDSAAWPARLEHWLTALAPERRVEVINAGVPGYSIEQDLIRLQTELFTYQPDLIIFYQGHNDLFGNLKASLVTRPGPGGQRPSEVQPIAPWTRWLEQHSLLYTKLTERARLMGFYRLRARPQTPAPAGPVVETPIDLGGATFERLVSTYLAVAQSLGLRVVVPEVIHFSGTVESDTSSHANRIWQAAVPFAAPGTVLQGYREYNRILQRMAEKYGVTFLPMNDLGIAGTSAFAPDDPVHFNDQGADRFAAGLAARLLKANLVPSLPR